MPQTLLISTTDRNCRPTWHKFQLQGGNEYTIHSAHILLAPFEFCGRIFDQWPPIRESPQNNHLPLPRLYIHRSLVFPRCDWPILSWCDVLGKEECTVRQAWREASPGDSTQFTLFLSQSWTKITQSEKGPFFVLGFPSTTYYFYYSYISFFRVSLSVVEPEPELEPQEQ